MTDVTPMLLLAAVCWGFRILFIVLIPAHRLPTVVAPVASVQGEPVISAPGRAPRAATRGPDCAVCAWWRGVGWATVPSSMRVPGPRCGGQPDRVPRGTVRGGRRGAGVAHAGSG